MTTTYLAGQTERLIETFTTSAGTLTDPTTVGAVVVAPDGTSTSKAYPGDITRSSTGVYYFDLQFTQAGTWQVSWTGTGTLAASDYDTYTVTANPPLGYGGGARSTMSDLIQAVRTLTFADTAEYTVGTASYWDDVQIQTMLDKHRRDLWHCQLEPIPTHTAGGTIQWKMYRAPCGDLEQTVGGTAIFQIQDGIGSTSGTANWTADYLRGLVTFGSDQKGTAYYLTARTYDIYGASAELLRAWAAREKLAYDVAPDNQSFRRSQKHVQLKQMADEYARQSWPMVAVMVRDDRDEWGGGYW